MKRNSMKKRGMALLLAVLLGAGAIPGVWKEEAQAAAIVQEGDESTLHPDKYLFDPGLSANMTAEPYHVTQKEIEEGAACWDEKVSASGFIVPVTQGKKDFGVIHRNVGTYKIFGPEGQVQDSLEVDLRVTCTQVHGPRNNWYNLEGTKRIPPTIKFYRNKLSTTIQSMQAATFRYEFLLHNTETPMSQVMPEFGGHATLVDLDGDQKVSFKDTSNIQAVYKNKNNPHLQVVDNGTAIRSDSQGLDERDENGWLTILYNGDFSLTFHYDGKERFQTDDSAPKQCVIGKQSTGRYRASYYGILPGLSIGSWKMQTNLEKRVGEKGCVWNKARACTEKAASFVMNEYKEFDYLVQHATTPQKSVVKYEFRDTLEECLDIDDSSKVKILNKSGENVTGQFNVAVTEGAQGRKNIVCSAKGEFLDTEAFFDQEVYTFCFTVHRKNNLDVQGELGKWLDEDGFHFYIPNQASLTWQYANGLEETAQSNVCWVSGIVKCDLIIEKDAKYDGWKVGDLVEYTVEVTQTRQDGYARNVVITDEDIPPCLRLVNNQWQVIGPDGGNRAPSISSVGENGWRVTCPLLYAGERIIVHFQCEALEDSNGKDTLNTAYVTADNFLDNWGEQKSIGDDAEIWVNSPSLTVEKIADHYEWEVGQAVEYQVVVKNVKDYTIAENVVISDLNLPQGLALVQEEGGVQIEVTPDTAGESVGIPVPDGTAVLAKVPRQNHVSVERAGNGWTARIAYLPSQATVTIRFFCIATQDANGLELQNQVFVQADNAPETGDDARVFVNTASLFIEKTADHYEWQMGDLVEYKVAVINENTVPGPSIARNVEISDMNLPQGLVLAEGEDAVRVQGIPQQVEEFRELTQDVPNEINEVLYGERYVKDVSWELTRQEQGWHLFISDLPAGVPVEVCFLCQVTEEVNGQEAVNVATVTAQNSKPGQDDAKVYINTAALSLEKQVYNPSYVEGSSRLPYEFRVGEEIIYQVVVRNLQKGSVARNLVVEDLSLPEGIVLAPVENPVTVEGIPQSIVNPITGYDPPNEINADHYKETEILPVSYNLEQRGAGFVLRIDNFPCTQGDELNQYTQPLVITCRCVASADVNGWEILNTALAYADNGSEVRDSERIWINSPLLHVQKRADRGKYSIGDTITYTVDFFQNQTGCEAKNVSLSDVIRTPGVKLQKNSIVLLDAQGRKIQPERIEVQENSFTVYTGRSLIREVPCYTWDVYQGGLRQMDGYNPPGVVSEPKMTVEYSAEVVDVNLAGSTVENEAAADSDEGYPSTDTEIVEIAGAVLDMEKEADRKEYQVGDRGYFRLAVRELRDEVMARNVTITDAMDIQGAVIDRDSILVRLNGKEIIPEAMEISDTGFFIRTGVSIGIEDKLEVFYEAVFVSPALDGRIITNTAIAQGANTPPAQGDCQVLVTEEEPVLEIVKTSDKDQYQPCQTGHYQVKVTQTQKGTQARNVVIKDQIMDPEAELVKGSLKIVNSHDIPVDQAEIEQTDRGYAVYTGQTLEYGEYFLVTYDVQFGKIPSSRQTVLNVARATAENLKPPQNQAPEPVKVSDGLLALKEASPQSGSLVNKGDIIEYSIILSNTSDQLKKNILVKDEIKDHLTLEGFTQEDASGVKREKQNLEGRDYATFYIPRLEPGETMRLSFSAKVEDAGETDCIVNVAQVRETRAEEQELTQATWTSDQFRNTNETLHYLDTKWVKASHEVEIRQTMLPTVTPTKAPAQVSAAPVPDPTPTKAPGPSPTGIPSGITPYPTGNLRPTPSPRPQTSPGVTQRPIATVTGRPGSSSGYGSSWDGQGNYYGGKTANTARTGDERPFPIMRVLFGVGCILAAAGIFFSRRKKR